MTCSPKLEIELIPRPLWGESLAKRYRSQWDKLRVVAYAKAGHRCEICGGTGKLGSRLNPGGLQAHEVWEYIIDGKNATQRLVRLIALCALCHGCKHMGRSFRVMPRSDFEKLQRHFMTVNGMRETEFHEYSAQVMEQWQYHNSLKWSQDLSAFLNAKVPDNVSPGLELRRQVGALPLPSDVSHYHGNTATGRSRLRLIKSKRP